MIDLFFDLTQLFQEYFDDQSITLKRETTAADIDEWDSLAQVGLILSIEKRFGIRFTGSEVEGLANVGEMIDAIQSKKQ